MKYEKTIRKIQEIYVNYCVGGPLHIVLDDDNVDNDSIQWCIDNIINKFEEYYKENENTIEEDRQLFLDVANELLAIKSEKIRKKIINNEYGYKPKDETIYFYQKNGSEKYSLPINCWVFEIKDPTRVYGYFIKNIENEDEDNE